MSGRLLGAVLAGGESRRFGSDKTAARVGGVRMLQRAVDALADACDEVVVVSSRDATPEGPWRVVPDLRPGRGPLAGIETALVEAEGKGLGGVFVLAADLPLVDPDVVRAVVEGATRGEAIAPERPGVPDFEPLCAIYRPACLPAVRDLLDEGRAAARELFERVDGRRVAIPGGRRMLLNVNTPADLVDAEARLDSDVRHDSEARSDSGGARATDGGPAP